MQTASEKATLTRLQAEETRRTNQRAMLYEDRLSKLITADHFASKAAEINEALDEIKRQRERLGATNAKFREEGSAIIDMMRSVKAEYMAATPERKAIILSAILDKVVLRPNDHYVTFREPFGQLFGLHRVMTEREKGE